MSTILEEFENKAKNLPLKDRAALIESLISSLDELDEAECQELWVQEADKRYQAYKAGTITSKPAEAVFNDAKEMLERTLQGKSIDNNFLFLFDLIQL